MTTQEAYERIRNGILEQGKLGINTNGECVYQSVHDNKTVKCAAGQLLPVYDYAFESTTFSGLLTNAREVAEDDRWEFLEPASREAYRKLHKWATTELSVDVECFIADAQSEHDSGSYSLKEFIEKLDDLADEKGLKVVTE